MILVGDAKDQAAILGNDTNGACGRTCCAAHSYAMPEPRKFMPFLLMESALGRQFPE